jgi:hypothetical protein
LLWIKDSNQVSSYKNNTLIFTQTRLNSAQPYTFAMGHNNSAGSFNFGQRPFAYTAPSGFKALCTTNLAEPTIADGSTAMDVALYTGNGSTQTISGLNFSPDLVWIKERSSTSDNALWNTVVGVGSYLSSNLTSSEFTTTTELTSIDSGGFTLGSSGATNENSQTYAAWTWDAGSSTVTNTDGSITCQVRANASAGFSVVTWTGSGAVGTIGHGLNVKPGFIVVKSRTNTEVWYCYHSSLGSGQRIQLNETSAAVGSVVWNGTEPTSSVFSITSSQPNTSGQNYVAYCFAPVDGYSSFGSYTGNGSTDGPFVYTGFKPRWVMIKRSSSSGGIGKRNDEARDAVIRLTSAVEHIALQLEVMHTDIKDDRRETFKRLNEVEQRVSKLEAHPHS